MHPAGMLIDAASWDKVSALFDQVATLTPAQRKQRLADLELDAATNTWLQKLLAAHDSSDTQILDQTLNQIAADLIGADAGDVGEIPAQITGLRLGNWRVGEPIARGAMAAVFHGQRADDAYEQHVAIKLLQPGPYQQGESEQLREELRLLARLEHPGIARLIDGGISGQGWPYLVMEYVDGVHIDQWCAEHKLDWQQRIDLMLKVCEAVRYAHSKLVVHADIKPSNVLVNQQGEPKLVDFGIAGLLHKNPDSDPPAASALLRCSPAYAAPEQLRGELVSTSNDVFGLGALMYELLTGRRIRDGKTVTALMLGHAQVDQIIAPCQLSNSKLPGGSSGKELDAICLQALAQDPQQRYGSVTELRQDLHNTLQHYPVAARTDTAFYRLNCWLRRHNLAMVAVTGIFASLVIGLTVALLQAEKARDQAARSAAISIYLQGLFSAIDPFASGNDYDTTQKLFTEAGKNLTSLQGQHVVVQATTLNDFARVANAIGKHDEAIKASQTASELLGNKGNDDLRLLVAATHARALLDSGDAQQAIAMLQAWLPPERLPDDPTLAELEAMLTLFSAYNVRDRGVVERSMPLLRILRNNETRLLQQDAELWLRFKLLQITSLVQSGNYQAVTEMAAEVEQIAAQHFDKDSLNIATLRSHIASSFYQRGNYRNALQAQQKVLNSYQNQLGPEHPYTYTMHSHVAASRMALAQFDQALQHYEFAAAGYRKHYGESYLELSTIERNMGDMYRSMGELQLALAHLDAAERLDLINRGADSPMTGLTKVYKARALAASGAQAQAAELFATGLAAMRSGWGAEHPLSLRMQADYGWFLHQQKQFAQALELLQPAYTGISAIYGEDSLHTALAVAYLGLASKDYGVHQQQAQQYLQQCREHFTADSILRKRFPDLARRIDQAMPALATDA
jgi:eukaryotic-like serine/threonine-protein kinase